MHYASEPEDDLYEENFKNTVEQKFHVLEGFDKNVNIIIYDVLLQSYKYRKNKKEMFSEFFLWL